MLNFVHDCFDEFFSKEDDLEQNIADGEQVVVARPHHMEVDSTAVGVVSRAFSHCIQKCSGKLSTHWAIDNENIM